MDEHGENIRIESYNPLLVMEIRRIFQYPPLFNFHRSHSCYINSKLSRFHHRRGSFNSATRRRPEAELVVANLSEESWFDEDVDSKNRSRNG